MPEVLIALTDVIVSVTAFLTVLVAIATYVGCRDPKKAEKMNEAATRVYQKIGLIKRSPGKKHA